MSELATPGYTWTSPRRRSEWRSDTIHDAVRRPHIHNTQADMLGESLDALTIREQLLSTLKKTESDWRSVGSLAREISTSEARVRRTLESMPDQVRQPIAPRGDEVNYYRLAARGLTRKERWRYVLLVLSRQAR